MDDPRKGRRNEEAVHRRWHARVTNEEWSADQCGICLFWIPLAGRWGLDYGSCCNPDSQNDAHVMYEHDRCSEFRRASKWAVPQDFVESTRWSTEHRRSLYLENVTEADLDVVFEPIGEYYTLAPGAAIRVRLDPEVSLDGELHVRVKADRIELWNIVGHFPITYNDRDVPYPRGPQRFEAR